MLPRALIFTALCIAAISLYAGEPFDVSLAHSSADLSPYYRAVVREATERYRGDGPSHMVTARIRVSQAAGIEIEEVTDYSRGTTDLYLRSISAVGDRKAISEVHCGNDPFPAELVSLDYAIHATNQASNKSLQPTASRRTTSPSDD